MQLTRYYLGLRYRDVLVGQPYPAGSTRVQVRVMCSDRRMVNEDVLEFEEGLRYNNFDKFEHISSRKRYVTESRRKYQR